MVQNKKQLILEHIPVISYVRHGVCLSCSRTVLAKRNATGWLPSSILNTADIRLKASDRWYLGAKLCKCPGQGSSAGLVKGLQLDVWRIGVRFSASLVILSSPFCPYQLRDRLFIYCTVDTLSLGRAASKLLRGMQKAKKDCGIYLHCTTSYLAKPVKKYWNCWYIFN